MRGSLWLALMAAAMLTQPAVADEDLRLAFEDYASFVPFDAGIVLPRQLEQDIFEAVAFIDTRSAEAYADGTIPGAAHIEWREVFSRLDEAPTDQKVVFFCDTGALSAQVVFGLRVMGYDNALLLQTGFVGWQETGAYRP